MAGMTVCVHPNFAFDYGPAKNFVPPGIDIQVAAHPGGGQPSEANALTFIDSDGEAHVYVMSEETKRKLMVVLTGGIVVAGQGDLLGDVPGGPS